LIDPSQQDAADRMAADFESRAAARKLEVGVVGLGYVGLPLVEAFAASGLHVIGFDIDASKIERLRAGRTYIGHIPDERIASLVATERFTPTSDPNVLGRADAILMCVPTPLNAHREPDLSYVRGTCEAIAAVLRPGQLVVLESTTYPGTSDEIVRQTLEARSTMKSGRDFAIAYSPEREDPGNRQFDAHTIPKVVGADTAAELRMATALYSCITQVVPVSNLRTAEAVKLTENIFRLVNIALVNELKVVFRGMDIDIWEVIDAAATKPFGFMPFYPGPGLGGHCIPVDPFYLTWKAREHGENTRFVELAGEIMSRMPRLVIETIAEAMSSRLQRSISGARILVVGLAYKKNVDDMRESPSLHLMNELKRRGAEVSYFDPHIPVVPPTRDNPEFSGLGSVEWSAASLKRFDCAIIATDHDHVDYAFLAEHTPLLIDTRNVCAALPQHLREKVVKA
jgi:UDP-N-acetyl-D-glucosamine dehydrogenase